jgi:pimeloyl-ACP methyl ester carboxylesterase
MFLKVVFVLLGLYVLFILAIAASQTSLLFPARIASAGRSELPASARRLEFETPDGVRLHGVYLPSRLGRASEAALLLAFGGNAWNAEVLATYISAQLPDRDLVAFHYRGYAPSQGSPSASSLMQDAVAIHDFIMREIAPARIIAFGISIGAGPVAYLTHHRKLAGAVLITPFDSLGSLARDHYWWAPVRLLLRHRMEVAELLSPLEMPVAIIAAQEDRIVPAPRTEALRKSIKRLVFDRTIADAGHNDIYDRPEFAAALKEAVRRLEEQAG